MIHRFATLPEAITFMNESKLKGHYAEILHFHTGHLWCEMTTLGFPVLVSEEAHEEFLEEEMRVYWIPQFLSNVLTFLFVIFMSLMGLSVAFVLAFNFLLLSSLFPKEVFAVVAILMVAVTAYTYLMNQLYEGIRNVQENSSRSFFYYWCYMPVMSLLILFYLPVGILYLLLVLVVEILSWMGSTV